MMKDNHENCPYCGNPFRIGAIEISGRGNQVKWVAEPKPLGRAFYWGKKVRLFRSFLSTYRNALWCQECHLVIIDPRNPEKLQTISPNETGPWKHFFPLEERL